MSELLTMSAAEMQRHVRAGDLSRREVVEAHLSYIAEANPKVGALTQVREEEAIKEANEADADADRTSLQLDGVVVSVKEQYDVAGLASTEGCAALADRRADRDSTPVARLRAQGAIVIGKGNEPDFAMRWNTISSAIGATCSPRDLSASAGGSSGGDAASVAGGLSHLGLGTDLAGSIRVPAAFCAVYGLRATPGRIPFDTQFPPRDRAPAYEAMASQGLFARTVSDLHAGFAAMSGAAPSHPFSSRAPRAGDIARTPIKVARIVEQSGARVDSSVRAALDATAEILQSAGYEVEDAAFPGVARAPDLWGELVCSELRLLALPELKDAMEPSCWDHIDKLSQLWETVDDAEALLRRWVQRTEIQRQAGEWMEEHPLILAPVAGMELPLPVDYDSWASSDDLAELVERMRNCLWPPLVGLPAVALPNGCQIVARPYQEEEALGAAAALEERGGPVQPTLVGSGAA